MRCDTTRAMKLLLLSLVAVCSLTACKKTDKSASTGSASPPTTTAPVVPADASSDAPLAAASGSAAPPAGAGSGSDSDLNDADCELYGKVSSTCAHNPEKAAIVAKQCHNSLAKNDPMASSIRAQIACAKANAECNAYGKCLLLGH